MKRRLLLGALIVTSVVLQVAVFPEVRLLGVVPDLGAVLAVCVAYHSGSDSAALVGFFAGLGVDLFMETPLGLWALAYALTGWAVGPIQGGFIRTPRAVPLLLGAFAGVVSNVLFVVLGVISGVAGLVAWDTLGIIARSTLYDTLLAPFVFLVVQRLLAERTLASTYHFRTE